MWKPGIRGNWIAAEIGAEMVSAWAMEEARPAHSASTGRVHDDPKADLLALVQDWLDPQSPAEIVACGAGGATLQHVPAKPLELPARPEAGHHSGVAITWLPGLCQEDPPAIMRGPETRIAGFLSLNPGWDGVLCLPGAQTVWAHVSAEEVVSFQCFLTPRLVRAMTDDPARAGCIPDHGWDESAFADALANSIARPERLAAQLAEIAARRCLPDAASAVGHPRLWGTLIGAELAAARPYWLGQQIAIIGETQAADFYHRALSLQGVSATIADDTAMLLTGIRARKGRM